MKKNRRAFIRQSGLTGLGLSTVGLGSGLGRRFNFIGPKEMEHDIYNGVAPSDWNVFDAHCIVGRHLKWNGEGLHTMEDLLSEMDHYGITEALVVDSLSRENHPFDGNQRILERSKTRPRIHPAWSVLPSVLEETGRSPEQFFREMQRNNVRALFLFTNQFFFNLSDWCIDALMEPLAERKVLVFINPVEANGRGSSDATDWDGIVDLCKRWPDIPVIISEGRIRRSQRMLYKAFDACPNLHLELSAHWLHRGIEFISEHWGANRLVFGSGWPKYGQHMTLVNLTTAQIDEKDKKLIAGDNLRKILSWDTPIPKLKVDFPEPHDEYVKYGRSGIRPSDMTFYDVHGHLGEYNAHYHVPESDIESVVEDIQYYGLEKICAFSFAGVYSDEVFGNDIVSRDVKMHSDRFIGFTLLNPLRGEEEMNAELKRGAAQGMRGIKLIPTYQGYPVEGPLIEVACQWAHDHQQIIINHYWGSAEQIEKLVSKYTKACFVTAHTTTAYADVMKEYQNLYICSVPLLSPRACEEVVDAIGADRFLFGTDLLDLPIGWGLGPILFARISTEEKRLILHDNLKNILTKYSL
ncbi:amidohydrolase family protein [Membranicola marinus]|uniref:Amidohydrolase family protein n=1 Tax=Membranihabitans marinus TaxID=1227546 RepID=A0A953L620_9BACT|nr:amidohydrolase family protein [Membranihabitans marinus]MBY5957192.1 amidohydrolase family protein [Membranihabitans marinus]